MSKARLNLTFSRGVLDSIKTIAVVALSLGAMEKASSSSSAKYADNELLRKFAKIFRSENILRVSIKPRGLDVENKSESSEKLRLWVKCQPEGKVSKLALNSAYEVSIKKRRADKINEDGMVLCKKIGENYTIERKKAGFFDLFEEKALQFTEEAMRLSIVCSFPFAIPRGIRWVSGFCTGGLFIGFACLIFEKRWGDMASNRYNIVNNDTKEVLNKYTPTYFESLPISLYRTVKYGISKKIIGYNTGKKSELEKKSYFIDDNGVFGLIEYKTEFYGHRQLNLMVNNIFQKLRDRQTVKFLEKQGRNAGEYLQEHVYEAVDSIKSQLKEFSPKSFDPKNKDEKDSDERSI